MSIIATTGSKQVEFLQANYNGRMLSLKSVGGSCHYVPVSDSSLLAGITAIRTAEATVTVSDMAEAASGVITYTVADSSLFRVGESIPVLQSSVQVGAITIKSLASATTITANQSNGSSYSPADDDDLLLREDEFIAEDDSNKFASNQYKYLVLQSESSSVKLVVELLGTGLVKKY